MERNITNLVYDIQKLDRDIRREDELTIELIKSFQYRSNQLRKMVDRIVSNQKEYPSYVALNLNEQQQIEYAYHLLNQIDLIINTPKKQININKKIPFSFRSFIITIAIIISIFLYYKIFFTSKWYPL
jgi:hypothetical protein